MDKTRRSHSYLEIFLVSRIGYKILVMNQKIMEIHIFIKLHSFKLCFRKQKDKVHFEERILSYNNIKNFNMKPERKIA